MLWRSTQMQSKKRDLFTLGEDEIFYRFALCLVPQCLQQWRGSNLISSYSTTTFENGLLAIQFLVTIRFATNGPKFDVDKAMRTDNDEGSSLVYSKALMIILISLLSFTPASFGAFIFRTPGYYSYIAWAVVTISETIVAIAVSSVYRNISFKGTHLVRCTSLLILIILGEGVIVIAKPCQRNVKSAGVWHFGGSTVGNIIAAVLILYFIYTLYFDWMQEEHFGTIRRQIWWFLHFSLPLTLL